jgi:hypothetical protein
LSNLPLLAVTVCLPSTFFQVTLSPRLTLIRFGLKSKLTALTGPPALAGHTPIRKTTAAVAASWMSLRIRYIRSRSERFDSRRTQDRARRADLEPLVRARG